MKKNKNKSAFQKAFKRNYPVISALIIAFLVILIIIILIDNKEGTKWIITKNILITVLGIIGVSSIWEIIGKSFFLKELLDDFQITNDLFESRIEKVYARFPDINWSKILPKCRDFKAFMIYGYSWSNDNRYYIEKARENCKNMIIVLPDYNIPSVVDELNNRFGLDENENSIKKQILDSAKRFLDLSIDVYLYEGTLCSSYYLYDNHCIYCLSKHGEKKVSVPAIQFGTDSPLYKFVENDFERIMKKSKKICLGSNNNVEYSK